MTISINQAFEKLLLSLTPSEFESEKARSHRESVYDCLVKTFNIENFFRSGSFGFGTSVSGYSDIDYFAIIPPSYGQNKSPETILNKFKEVLLTRFPQTEGICINRPAVQIPFGSQKSEKHEIIPAKKFPNGIGGDSDVYSIANPAIANEWIKSNPIGCGEWINNLNKKFEAKVKPLIRMIKAWKYYNDVEISSFYLEVAVTQYFDSSRYMSYQEISYPKYILYILKYMQLYGLKPLLQHDYHIHAVAYKDISLHRNVSSNWIFYESIDLAEQANEAEQEGNIQKALEIWKKFFNGRLPTS